MGKPSGNIFWDTPPSRTVPGSQFQLPLPLPLPRGRNRWQKQDLFLGYKPGPN